MEVVRKAAFVVLAQPVVGVKGCAGALHGIAYLFLFFAPQKVHGVFSVACSLLVACCLPCLW
jgi:hypothetical protein